jgi:hypothetical protein
MMSLNPLAVPFNPHRFAVAKASDQQSNSRNLENVLADTQLTLQATSAKLECLVSGNAAGGVVKTEATSVDCISKSGKPGEQTDELEFDDLFNHHGDTSEDVQTPRAEVVCCVSYISTSASKIGGSLLPLFSFAHCPFHVSP